MPNATPYARRAPFCFSGCRHAPTGHAQSKNSLSGPSFHLGKSYRSPPPLARGTEVRGGLPALPGESPNSRAESGGDSSSPRAHRSRLRSSSYSRGSRWPPATCLPRGQDLRCLLVKPRAVDCLLGGPFPNSIMLATTGLGQKRHHELRRGCDGAVGGDRQAHGRHADGTARPPSAPGGPVPAIDRSAPSRAVAHPPQAGTRCWLAGSTAGSEPILGSMTRGRARHGRRGPSARRKASPCRCRRDGEACADHRVSR